MNAFKLKGSLTNVLVEGNEIVGNNADDIENKQPGCGCTGGIKFWDVNGADIRGNWVHDNRGVGLWADTNNNDFLLEDNLIEKNDDEGVVYEISYNMIMRGNTLRQNGFVKGKKFADRGDNFPMSAVYISESGGEPRIPARTDRIEITNNVFTDNWGGITAWENADRFCNSVANTSSGYCTLLQPDEAKCTSPGIDNPPLLGDCRWKTQRVEVSHNRFNNGPNAPCVPGRTSRMAILANVGTVPEWSPYRGDVVQKAITYGQDVRWHDNAYTGFWSFTSLGPDKTISLSQWQATPSGQDAGSTFEEDAASC
jgi:parallel beta-helix repeat protein